jgi:hypothetical protein
LKVVREERKPPKDEFGHLLFARGSPIAALITFPGRDYVIPYNLDGSETIGKSKTLKQLF